MKGNHATFMLYYAVQLTLKIRRICLKRKGLGCWVSKFGVDLGVSLVSLDKLQVYSICS